MNYVISTDTGTDFKNDDVILRKLLIQPLDIVMDGIEYGFYKEAIEPVDFFEKMRQGSKPTTVAANPQSMIESFRSVIDEGRDVLHLSFSSAMSSSFQNALFAAGEFADQKNKVHVVDLKAATASEDLLVDIAVKCQRENMPLEDLVVLMEELVKKAKVEFIIADLFHLMRGGRLSKTSAVLGSALNISPILSLDEEGKIVPKEKVRGRKKALKKLAENFKESYDADFFSDVYISHSDALDDAKFLASLVEEEIGKRPLIFDMSLTIGSHTGPASIVMAYIKK